ncbi:class I SAM-dependent methyltransferase [Yoonia sp. 2307UL14-13]|uniref:class I SAM-dependent methyltransferase n=1 Tax=Yoonia sp. 2307UL14-13 TaxID=3126506 RepID=UPI0030ACE056
MSVHPLPHTHDAAIPVFARWFGTWRVSVERRPLDARQLARFYDAEAATWDSKLARLGVGVGYEQVLRQVFPRNHPVPEVLDAGIGTGALSVALSNVIDGSFYLSGVDLSAGMLARARERLGVPRCHLDLRQADMTALPYADNSFDVVMTAHTLEHLHRPQQAIRELVRVLRPGGMMVACVTQTSLLGAYIQVKWHTHRVSAQVGRRWLSENGLTGVRVIPMAQGGGGLSRLSVAYVGWKGDTH